MMGRRSINKIRKIEEKLSAAQKERNETRKQAIKELHKLARRHAIAVAAIALSGQPKIDEPLRRAWGRALQHYEIKGEDYIADPGRLSAEIMQGRPASERLAEIFKMAPVWLLQFTGVAMDARFLQFDLPLLAEPLRWGSNGYEDARRWPLLPDGTMTAGDPIPHADARQLWITVFCKITVAIPDFEDNLLEEHEETHSEHPGLVDDLGFALDLDGTPEKEWTRYERRRMRRISEWILDGGTRRSGRH